MTEKEDDKNKVMKKVRGNRIRVAMTKRGIRGKDLAAALGLRPPDISKILSGDRDITAAEMSIIENYVGKVTGFKKSLQNEDFDDFPQPQFELGALTDNREFSLRKIVSSLGYSGAGIPEVDVLAGAGEGTEGEIVNISIGDETYSGHSVRAEWQLPDEYTRHFLNIVPGQSIIIQIVGDSMSPTYNHGDRILVDMRQNSLLMDGVYLISDGFSPPQVKRLQRVLFSDPQAVDIVSDNKGHATQRVELEPLRVIGRVACKIQAT